MDNLEVVKEEVGRCDTDCVDNVDMDLDVSKQLALSATDAVILFSIYIYLW